MGVERSSIRYYAAALLTKELQGVGDKIFMNRPNPVFLEELPCVLIYFEEENVEVISGDNEQPVEYQRNLRLSVDCWAEEQRRDDLEDPNKNQSGEDYLDYLGEQIETIFADDFLFAKLLPGYDPNTNYDGLLMGMRILSVTPYDPNTEGDRKCIAQRLLFEMPYQTSFYKKERKFKDFSEYLFQIIRVGSDESTIDRVLLEAEGEL